MILITSKQFTRFHNAAGDASELLMAAKTSRGNQAGVDELNRTFAAEIVVGYWQDGDSYTFDVIKGRSLVAHMLGDTDYNIDDVRPVPTFFYCGSAAFARLIDLEYASKPNGR